jgi:hypothetical protein
LVNGLYSLLCGIGVVTIWFNSRLPAVLTLLLAAVWMEVRGKGVSASFLIGAKPQLVLSISQFC